MTGPTQTPNKPARAFAHAMLKEIFQQTEALAATLDHYVAAGQFIAESFGEAAACFAAHADLIIAASGSSRHAGLAAEIMFEDTAGIAVDVEYASEYITRTAAQKFAGTKRRAAVLVISQSGETADTLTALREAKRRGCETLAITNVAISTMAREAGISLPTCAGVERAVPATKSFTTQLLVLRLLSLFAAQARNAISPAALEAGLAALAAVPANVAAQLPRWEQQASALAAEYQHAKTLLYLGRGIHYAAAREGALKLKESSYIHAEGYPSGELKHGPNALVDDNVPLVVLATVARDDAESVLRYDKTIALLEDLRKQNARTIVLGNSGDEAAQLLATHFIAVDEASEYLLPLYEVIPMQMFAYFMAIANGVDVDRPRNLVKAVVRE